MNPTSILLIVEYYQKGLCTFLEASLWLVVEGLSPQEVTRLLETQL